MTAFSPMDSWIVAAGRTDAWLSLGLDLLERWQAEPLAADGTDQGQAHLVEVLHALAMLRPVPPVAPDPVVLAAWFHHCAVPDSATLSREAVLELSATTAYDRLAGLGEPALAREVARLVRQLGVRPSDRDDAAGDLLRAAHRAALAPTHLAAVPPVRPLERDQ